MTSSVSNVGSVQAAAVQVTGAAGASVRVQARLYDPDSALLTSSTVGNVILEVIERSAADIPLVTLPTILSSSVLSSVSAPASWTKDSTGRNFDHLLPANIAALLVGGRSYVLRYTFDTPGASGTDFGLLRWEAWLGAS